MIEGQVVDGLFVRGRVLPIELPRAGQERNCVLKLGYDARVGGSTIYDRSGQGNNGTITGATWVRLPSGLWMLNFDGDDRVKVANSCFPQQPLSASLWVYPTSVTTGANNPRIMSTSFARISLRQADAALAFHFYNGATWTTVNKADFFTINTWHLISIRKSSDIGAILYRNAVQVAAVSDAASKVNIEFVDQLPRFGAQEDALDAWSQFFNGRIALARIANVDTGASAPSNIFNQERHLFNV